MSTEIDALTAVEETAADEECGLSALRVITWLSVGMAVAAIGVLVGREVLSRARFKKRTPYDFYAQSGETQANEFGVGI